MATFVIVHGGMGGGWEWSEVAQGLRARGHVVFTPTLTGLGERAHLASPDVGLRTHIEDLVGVLEKEDLREVILCAASYGGMPATGAADRMARRIGLLVYIDAIIPQDGQAAADLLPAEFSKPLRAAAKRKAAGWWQVKLPANAYPPREGIDPKRREAYVKRLVVQPARTFLDPIRLTEAVNTLPRAYVRCTAGQLGDEHEDPMAPMAKRARDEGWIYRELPTPHDPHLFAPERTADVLDELARRAAKRRRR